MNLVLKIHKIFHSILYIRISESFLAQFTSHNHPHRSRTPVIVVTNKETKRQQCQHPPKSVLTTTYQLVSVWVSRSKQASWWGLGKKVRKRRKAGWFPDQSLSLIEKGDCASCQPSAAEEKRNIQNNQKTFTKKSPYKKHTRQSRCHLEKKKKRK